MTGINKEAMLSRRVESLFDEAQASASVPVVAVVTYPHTLALRDRMIMRAYLITATSTFRPRMQLTRNFTATIKGFNEAYGARCRNWAQVAQCADYLLNPPSLEA